MATQDQLIDLERSLWRTETRHNKSVMESIFADDFFEFGRSGRRWSRADCIDLGGDTIDATLSQIRVDTISQDVALVTYVSDVGYADGRQLANRSSLWKFMDGRWQLCFHQGTPTSRPLLG